MPAEEAGSCSLDVQIRLIKIYKDNKYAQVCGELAGRFAHDNLEGSCPRVVAGLLKLDKCRGFCAGIFSVIRDCLWILASSLDSIHRFNQVERSARGAMLTF